MKKNRVEHIIRIKEREDVRKKNIADYFINFSKYHRIWLHELADKYKELGDFPMIPMVVLPSFYDNVRDKEIAAYAALLIKDGAEFVRIQEFREMLGNEPWAWFENREFVRLSVGGEQNKRTGGVENWKIAKLMDVLWNEQNDPIIQFGGIEETLRGLSFIQHCSYFDILTYLLMNCSVGQFFYKLRLLLMVLGTDDGFGLNLWKVQKEQLQCPLADGLRSFIKTWFPDFDRIGNMDDAISLFGFEKDCDFFYAWLGYKELQKSNPKGCSAYATAYLRWYEGGIRKKPYEWREVIPELTNLHPLDSRTRCM